MNPVEFGYRRRAAFVFVSDRRAPSRNHRPHGDYRRLRHDEKKKDNDDNNPDIIAALNDDDSASTTLLRLGDKRITLPSDDATE